MRDCSNVRVDVAERPPRRHRWADGVATGSETCHVVSKTTDLFLSQIAIAQLLLRGSTDRYDANLAGAQRFGERPAGLLPDGGGVADSPAGWA
jgi:hypothetical protein